MSPGETGPELRTDEELQDLFTGDLKPHNAPITLTEYDPGWPRLFDREAARIRAVLGDVALRVEHVGSTSVPGLAAKPIIDILLVVPDSVDEPSYLPALESAGYVQLSASQVYRLVTDKPERLSMRVLIALCDILDCTPADLIDPYRDRSNMTTAANPASPWPFPGSSPANIATTADSFAFFTSLASPLGEPAGRLARAGPRGTTRGPR